MNANNWRKVWGDVPAAFHALGFVARPAADFDPLVQPFATPQAALGGHDVSAHGQSQIDEVRQGAPVAGVALSNAGGVGADLRLEPSAGRGLGEGHDVGQAGCHFDTGRPLGQHGGFVGRTNTIGAGRGNHGGIGQGLRRRGTVCGVGAYRRTPAGSERRRGCVAQCSGARGDRYGGGFANPAGSGGRLVCGYEAGHR